MRAISQYGCTNADLFLFGSRASDSKKGGDVDLLMIVTDEGKAHLQKRIGELKSDLAASIGDQKVDLVLVTEQEAQRDPSIKSILAEAILPNSW